MPPHEHTHAKCCCMTVYAVAMTGSAKSGEGVIVPGHTGKAACLSTLQQQTHRATSHIPQEQSPPTRPPGGPPNPPHKKRGGKGKKGEKLGERVEQKEMKRNKLNTHTLPNHTCATAQSHSRRHRAARVVKDDLACVTEATQHSKTRLTAFRARFQR